MIFNDVFDLVPVHPPETVAHVSGTLAREVMVMLRRGWDSLWLLLTLIGLVAFGAVAQQPPADVPATPITFRVSVSGFAVPVGERIAVEFVRHPSPGYFYLTDPIYVQGWTLIECDGAPLSGAIYEDAPEIGEWIGTFPLRDAEGSPLPPAAYCIEISTTVGTFTAGIEVIDGIPSGRSRLALSACGPVPFRGLSLEVYRLVSEEDAGRTFDLRIGEQLMVLLDGNPTTGYEWSDESPEQSAVLSPLADPEYRAASPELLGSGGQTIFRYQAVDIGSQAFQFVYKRPWETTDSDREFSFDVVVR